MAEEAAIQQSLISWLFTSLGFFYSALLPLAGLMSFVLALVILIRGRGPFAAVALLLIVHVPLLIGLFAALQGAIASYTMIATSSAAPKPSDLAEGISSALVAPLIGLLLTAPSYALAAGGGLVRSLTGPSRECEVSSR